MNAGRSGRPHDHQRRFIAKEIELEDPYEKIGAELVEEVASLKAQSALTDIGLVRP